MRTSRQQKLHEQNATVADMEDLLYDAECTVASLRHTAPPPEPEYTQYSHQNQVIARLAEIKQRLEELAVEKAAALAQQYRVPENAGPLVRCLHTRLE